MERTQDIALERGLIAALINGADIMEIVDSVHLDYFTNKHFKDTYQACLECLNNGDPVEIIHIARHLREANSKVQSNELIEFADVPRTSATLDEMAEQLRQVWQSRRLESLGRKLISGFLKHPVDTAYQEIQEIMMNQQSGDEMHASDIGVQAFEAVSKRVEAVRQGKKLPGMIYTGISDLDKMQAMYVGETSVWAGRPGMGKTAIMMNLALNIAKQHIPVYIFSLEIPKSVLVEKMICILAEVNYLRVRSGTLDDQEYKRFTIATKKFNQLDITFSEDNRLTGLLSNLKRWRMRNEGNQPCVSFFDYVQRASNNTNRGNREQEIAGISRALCDFGKKNNTHIAMIAQLSRAVESRGGDKKPIISDLRESGQLEQDAHMIIFPYRAEYYGFITDDEGNNTEGLMELLIRKNRNGAIGNIKAQFIAKYQKVTDWAYMGLPEPEPAF